MFDSYVFNLITAKINVVGVIRFGSLYERANQTVYSPRFERNFAEPRLHGCSLNLKMVMFSFLVSKFITILMYYVFLNTSGLHQLPKGRSDVPEHQQNFSRLTNQDFKSTAFTPV